MPPNEETMKKINSFLRSVHRYARLVALDAPDILKELEDGILTSRLSDLEPEEVMWSFVMWDDFLEEQEVEDVLLIEQIDMDLKKMPPN